MPPQDLDALFDELEAAIQARNVSQACQLEQAILQRLAVEAAEYATLERRLRLMMADLEAFEVVEAIDDDDLDTTAASAPDTDPSPLDSIIQANRPRPAPPRATVIDPTDVERSAHLEEPHPSAKGVVYPVWFGTNRQPLPDKPGFTGARHPSTTLGRVEVFIPEAHRFGELGSSFWTRLLRFDLRDDHLSIQQVATLDPTAFYADIHQAMQAARDSNEEPQALVYLHGFNVSFEAAAIRTAQIGCDLEVPGATAFFSWPSRGSVAAYPADEASIEASERAITDFLIDFTSNCGAAKVHLIAHSMGNRGLLRALQRIAATTQSSSRPIRFGQIFLAAPDVDRDLFLDLARLYPAYSDRTTLYASRSDLAVHLSHRLHDAPRAGYFTPYTVVDGIDTIEVPDFDLDLLGHSYFAEAEALLYDLHSLMRNQASLRRKPASADGLSFWRLKR